MSYVFPINWPLRPPKQKQVKKGELAKPQEPFVQRCIVVKAQHDGDGPQLEVDFNNGRGTVELPKELCKQEGSKLVPDELKTPTLFKAIRDWAATVTHPGLEEGSDVG